MPIGIVFICLLICVLLIGVSKDMGDVQIFVVSLLCFLFLFCWIIVALVQDDVVLSKTEHKVHNCPEGYQYITLDGKPINITDRFGKVLSDNEHVYTYVYEDVYCGINFPNRGTLSTLSFEKVEEK